MTKNEYNIVISMYNKLLASRRAEDLALGACCQSSGYELMTFVKQRYQTSTADVMQYLIDDIERGFVK